MSKLTDLIRPLILLQDVTTLTGGGAGTLDGIETANLSVPVLGFAAITGMGISFYKLRAGTDAEASPAIIQPDDYAGGTNEKVWELIYASGSGTSATLYTFGSGDPPTDGSVTTQGYWDLVTGTHYINTAWPDTGTPTWVEA